MTTFPSLYIPHGGGPCFFMDDPHGNWNEMAAYLRRFPDSLPTVPKAILLVSAHWETDGFTFTGSESPDLLYDYYGFPPHTYDLSYPALGDPPLAEKAAALLTKAGIKSAIDTQRGFDHGVFIPLMLAFPGAEIPIVEMSLDASLDPALHIAAGSALASLRDEGVLIIGSGMSFHNMRAYGNLKATAPSKAFDEALTAAVLSAPENRTEQLSHWESLSFAGFSHPREEHLLPLMVAAGAGRLGRQSFNALVLKTAISGYAFE